MTEVEKSERELLTSPPLEFLLLRDAGKTDWVCIIFFNFRMLACYHRHHGEWLTGTFAAGTSDVIGDTGSRAPIPVHVGCARLQNRAQARIRVLATDKGATAATPRVQARCRLLMVAVTNTRSQRTAWSCNMLN